MGWAASATVAIHTPPLDTGGKWWHNPGVVSAVTTHFEHVVRGKLIANKLAGSKPDSIRGLAREMAKGDEAKAATFKRSLFKWMAPGEPRPSAASRALVADALGLAIADLDDDDEESDPVRHLMNALRLAVRAELAKERA